MQKKNNGGYNPEVELAKGANLTVESFDKAKSGGAERQGDWGWFLIT